MSSTNTTISLRDRIRSAVLDTKPEVHTVEYAGELIEVRAPSIEQLAEYQNADGGQSTDQVALGIIRHTYVPGTLEHVFDEADLDVVRSLTFGKDMRKLVTTITSMFSNEEVLDKGVKSAMKSPEGEPSGDEPDVPVGDAASK